jgi:hypothetical protein
MIDINELKSILNTKDPNLIASYIKKNNLKINDNKIIADNETIKRFSEFYDKRQLVRKILLNSALISGAYIQ